MATEIELKKVENLVVNRVFNILKKFPYLGSALMSTKVEISNENPNALAFTDGKRIVVNPDILLEIVDKLPENDRYIEINDVVESQSVVAHVLLHELIHILDSHVLAGRKIGADQFLGNIVADVITNNMILNALELRIPDNFLKNIITFDNLSEIIEKSYGVYIDREEIKKLSEKYKPGELTFDQLYYWIKKKIEEQERKGKGKGKRPRPGQKPQPDIEGYPGKKLNDNPWVNYPIDEREIERERDRISREALNGAVSRTGSPYGSGNETRITGRFLIPKISWHDVVFDIISQSSTVYTTYLYPDIRFTEEPFIIPGTKELERTDIIVAIDVSGSISDELYIEFMTEILGMIQQVTNVQILLIFFDNEIKKEKFIIKNTDDEYYLRSIKVPNTGGGTLFQPIFDYMNELYDKGSVEFEDREGRFTNIVAKNIVVLTDGCNADRPREYSRSVIVPYRIIWIIKPSGCDKPPIGEVYNL